MLSNSDALDIPDIETADQDRIRALGITLNQFVKTLQGRTILEQECHFVINGRLFQGTGGKPVETTEDMLTEDELANCRDIDGTRQNLFDTRRRRLEGMAYAKNRELGERRRLRISQERDELELRRLQREEAAYLRAQEEAVAAEPPVIYACSAPECGKTFDSARQLNAHKMGSKH